MGKRRWWRRSRGLPAETYAHWRQSLSAAPGRPARILAWARTAEGFCIGSPAVLSYGQDAFVHLGWHEIEHGSWNAETHRLSWTCYPESGHPRHGFVDLIEPARLPELFRERVAASIVLERFVPVTDDQRGPGIVISGRRDLAGAAEAIRWHASATRGLTWAAPGVRELAEEVLAQVRREYDTRQGGW